MKRVQTVRGGRDSGGEGEPDARDEETQRYRGLIIISGSIQILKSLG